MSFAGSCHCGLIRFIVDEPLPTQSMDCNCSICRRRMQLHHFTTPDKVTVDAAPEAVRTYRFNSEKIAHHFCARCGVATHGEGSAADGTTMININLRCVDGLDPAALEVAHFDGAHLL